MNTTKLLALTASLFMMAVPVAAAYGSDSENEVEQEDMDSDVYQSDVISNDNDLYIDNGYENDWSKLNDGAVSQSSCQLIVVADAWIGALSVVSALGVLSDNDQRTEVDFDFNDFPFGSSSEGRRGHFDLDAETATSSCDGSVGPIDIAIETAEGFDEPAPAGGSVSEAMTAAAAPLNRGGGGDSENEVEQEDNDAYTDQYDVIYNENDLDLYYARYGAVSQSNCQAIVGAHLGVWAASIVVVEGELTDDDLTDETDVEIGEEEPRWEQAAESESVDFEASEDFIDVEITNDATSTSSCLQTIDSITITIGGERDTLPPQS